MRALPALIIVAVLIAGAVFFAERPGRVELLWQGWRIDTSMAVLSLGVVALGVAAAALFHLLRKIIGGPAAFMRARRERRRRNGYRALTQGMVAVAAGDAEEAQKFARKADVLLAEPPLTLLLSAQAAQLSGDEHAARKYFNAMLERAETEFLGLRGLVMQALRRGEEATALHLIERARELRPRTPWVLSSLYELQARAGRWIEAEKTLSEAVKRKVLDEAQSRHHRAVLAHEKSRAAEAEGNAAEALKQAQAAHRLDPGFAPATARYATLLHVGGRARAALKAIEAGWRVSPHPELAEAWHAFHAEEPPLARVKAAERLAAANPDHPESRLAQARAALGAKLWGEARRHLEAAGAAPGEDAPPPTPRIARLMAEIEEQQHGDPGAARPWFARAAATSNLDHAWICSACGAESLHWTPLCPHCRGFATLQWLKPGAVAQGAAGAPRLSAAAGLMPALPVPTPFETRRRGGAAPAG